MRGARSRNHLRIVILDSVALDRCDPASYEGMLDAPMCVGSFATGDFIANKVADVLLVN